MSSIFKLDLRSLALVRFLLGILAFFDILNRFPQVVAFYSDRGIIPRWLLIDKIEIPWKTGLFNLVGDPSFVYIISSIGLVAALMMAIGLRTRLSTFIVWVILLSFHARFPEANHGGDNLLRLMLFMSMFLPMNAVFSVDGQLQETKIESMEFGSIFTAAWVIQILYVYFFTFYYKWTPTWFEDYDSVYYAMSLDMYTTWLGDVILKFHGLMKFMSFYAFWLEGLGPFLLLISYKRDFYRGLAVVLFWGLHLGIWTTMVLGNFPPGCLILWCALIPTSWWSWLTIKLTKKKETGILYYDPECGFCRKFSFIMKSLFLLHNVEIKAGNENPTVLEIIKNQKSWVFQADGQYYLRFKAFEKLLTYSYCKALSVFDLIKFSSWGGDVLYRLLSSYRYTWGVLLNKISFSEVQLAPSKFKKIMGLVFIALTFAWNLEGAKILPGFKLNSPIDEIVFSMQWNQQWNMFAPKPMRNDGWFITEATLADGSTWDILHDREYSEQRPDELHVMYQSSQWRKFLVNLYSDRDQTYLLWFGKYLCRNWNDLEMRPIKVQSYKLIFMRELTHAPSAEPNSIEKVIVWNHQCY